MGEKVFDPWLIINPEHPGSGLHNINAVNQVEVMMIKSHALPVRQQIEEQLVTELKNNKAYEKATEPVFTTDVGYVTLTFDDGPSVHTERLLEIMAEKGARAIFFMLGSNVEKFPQMARQVAGAGHVIGNHSYSHVYFTRISEEEAVQQMNRTNKIIEDAAGVTPTYFRPPYGAYNETTLLLATRNNLKVVMWSADPKDYIFNTGNAVFNATESIIASRNILLLHDLKEATVEALPRIIDTIREKNLEVTAQYEH